MSAPRENFGGRIAVIAAFAGAAIGLGNIWRFPYLVGQNGGSAFVLIYIFFAVLLSLPIFLAESVIGRSSGVNCRAAIGALVPGRAGRWFGLLMVLTPLWIMSYYSVIGGWSLEYLVQASRFEFVKMGEFVSRPWTPLFYHLAFLAITVGVVAFGVKDGIERFSKWIIPVLFLLIILIAVYSASLPCASKGIEYLVKPDFSKVTPHTFVAALGQAFFSMSLGMGINITYASYMKKSENMVVTAVGTSVSDLLFAILAAFAIIPAVFAAGVEPSSGPTLIFDTLPFIFTSMGQTAPVISAIAAILFFLAIVLAALSSSISLIEVGVAYLIEARKMSRGGACVLLFVVCGVAGALCSLSFGPLSGVRILGGSIFDFADSFASNVMLVAGSLVAVILVGWVMPRKTFFREITNGGVKKANVKLFPVIYFLVRYVAPIGIIILIGSIVL